MQELYISKLPYDVRLDLFSACKRRAFQRRISVLEQTLKFTPIIDSLETGILYGQVNGVINVVRVASIEYLEKPRYNRTIFFTAKGFGAEWIHIRDEYDGVSKILVWDPSSRMFIEESFGL